MDNEAADLTSRERAASSEPCSTRPNPFDDDSIASSSRKRQRVSRSASRSRSVDTARATDSLPDALPQRDEPQDIDIDIDIDLSPPHTPSRAELQHQQADATPSKFTINLRTARNLNSIPSSPPSPTTPSRMLPPEEDKDPRQSLDSESDALSTVPAMETPSSSPSAMGSPQIEIVAMSDDAEYVTRSPPLAIIEDDEVLIDPMSDFPYNERDEPLTNTVTRLKRHLQGDPIDSDDCFRKLRDWFHSYLSFTHDNPSSWHESYTRNRDFWNALPDLVHALSLRRTFFGPFLRDDDAGRLVLSEFFGEFARLAGRFVAMDARVFARHIAQNEKDLEPDLASYKYLYEYSYLLRKDENSNQHIGRNLEIHYDWDWNLDVKNMTKGFLSEGGTIANLTKLAKGYKSLLQQMPRMIDSLLEPCRLAYRIVFEASRAIDEADPKYIDAARRYVSQGYEFFKVTSASLDFIIDKHVTSLPPLVAAEMITQLTDILLATLSAHVGATEELFANLRKREPKFSENYYPKIISAEWRFSILHRLIISTQMQLRVVGVTTMCSELLGLHNSYKGLEPSHNPFLLHFADFIIKNKLIEYIVGIGSHPEIINESKNILGFLVSTKTYTPELTDIIWKTVMTSQDPRVVEAIVRQMVKGCLNIYEYQGLLDICKKVSELPLEAFNSVLREFCEDLIGCLIQKCRQPSLQSIDAPPYELCIRLIRESSVITPDRPLGYPDIQVFATQRLRSLLPFGPASEVRDALYLSCISDISARSPTTPGSVCAINSLLSQNLEADLRTLTTMHGFTEMIIEDLESSTEHDATSTVIASPASQARRELLLHIIMHQPETISPEMGVRLWDVLVGKRSRGVQGRTNAWQVLNSAVKQFPGFKNVFLASCYQEYLPDLPPDCFTLGTLDFARSAVMAWISQLPHGSLWEDQAFESPALEQLWRIILTAPPRNIDAPAIATLVEVFLEARPILTMHRAKARIIHLALVNRCLKQLAAAAAVLKASDSSNSQSDDEAMDIVAPDLQFQEQELVFARSLAVLREFLKAYQGRPHFAKPKQTQLISAAKSTVEGEPLIVKYQSFDGDTHTDVKVLTLGKLNTAASLLASLQEATGFKTYRVYHGGKEFVPDEVAICKSLEDLKLNGLVLVQRREDPDSTSDELTALDTTLEGEIMKHSDELWGYLGMHEKVAHEIYVFLIKFPIYDQLLTVFERDETTYLEIFPLGQPFKCLYAVHALRECVLAAQKREDTRDESATAKGLKHIVAAISDPDVLKSCEAENLRDALIINLLDCLVGFSRDTPYPELVTSCLNKALLERLLEILSTLRPKPGSESSIRLVCKTFVAVLEVTSHSPALWELLKVNLINGLLKDLIVADSRPLMRRNIARQLIERCAYMPSSSITRDFQDVLWSVVSGLIPEAVASCQSEDLFSLALPLFKQVLESTPNYPGIIDHIKEWATLLLSLEAKEIVGQMESVDLTVHGLANLLYYATITVKSLLAEAQEPEDEALTSMFGTIAIRLFEKHLFTPVNMLRLDVEETRMVQHIPVLNTHTRRAISETIYHLVNDNPAQYQIILESLARLVPYNLRVEYPYDLEVSWNFERIRAVRSWTGYVGLRNLSNTCYLNSLFTQLFMNVSFRDFMLTADATDRDQQRLLIETQVLFSNMQNSLKRFVDPQVVASSIRTYEEGNIDVSIQMDVDEFYNLLFDRWESQITSDAAKRTFRSFYGGQLVQQVKSKECEHISERLEPFSAIQCDIKGKSSLQESLQAYVDGEVMEGDNKYKCSTCDRHVDAVKRACLKDIPDNLIFHLKRFDFNLRTMQRSKINDYFSFPNTIDMRPYKVEHIMSSPEECPKDVFELVGILVHAGTAESGHYYSFIRERPSHTEDSWVEFNDDIVTPWKPEEMENSCFGGADYRGSVDHNTTCYDKNYSAYMLFYQRSSVLAAQKEELQKSGQPSPVRLPLAIGQYNHIIVDNELLMRKYCLFDPSHAGLVLKMFNNVRQLNKGVCSSTHELEKSAMWMALNFLDQVVARTKDLPDYPVLMGTIRSMCDDCVECSRDYLDWFCSHPETIRYLLLRNPEALVRTDISSSIFSALLKIRAEAPYAYGIGDDNDSDKSSDDPQLLPEIVRALAALWDQFHTNTRAWPEYFGLLFNISKLGDAEAVILIEHGFLRRVLELITADPNLPQDPQYNRMLNIISKRLNTRPVSYESVISLLYRLLTVVDRDAEIVSDHAIRSGGISRTEEISVPLSSAEHNIVVQHWVNGGVHILTEKLFIVRQNEVDSKNVIMLLLHWPDNLDRNIMAAIRCGIKPGPSFAPCGPFLRAALTYCEHSESRASIERLVKHIAQVARKLDTTLDGKDFLKFFAELQHLPSNLHEISRDDLFKLCAAMLPTWGPGLLAQADGHVRNATTEYIGDFFLKSSPDVDYGPTSELNGKDMIIVATAQNLGWQCISYLEEHHLRPQREILTPCFNCVFTMMETCERFFDEEDKEDQLSGHKFAEEKNEVAAQMRKLVVDEADDEVSEWDGSDDVGYSSSQAELTDLNEIEVQL